MPEPTLDDRGFVQVNCASCEKPNVWLRCDSCKKSDHFLFDGAVASCDCGARYAHATCMCGATVPPERLRFVEFRAGPMALADLAWDPRKIALLAVVVLAAVAVVVALVW